MENKIKEYFKYHKLNPTGIRNFLCYTDGARDWILEQIKKKPEYQSPGGYIICLLNNIELPNCRVCNKKIPYKGYKRGGKYCSKKCFKLDSNYVYEKTSETMLKKYGVKNCGSLIEVREKRKNTLMEKYGVENITQNKEYVKKAKKTMLKKYGVDNFCQLEENKRKWYKKSWENMVMKWGEYVTPMFSFAEYRGYKHGEEYNWKCTQCGNEFRSKIYMSRHIPKNPRVPRCLNCYPLHEKTSKPEKEIVEFIKTFYGGEILTNSSKIIPPLEIDIYIPEKKIAIEFNGLFWHSEKNVKHKKYHCVKSTRCEKKDIILLHIFEDEWRTKRKLVESRIKFLFGKYNNIYARNCKIKEISPDEKNEFMLKNHFSGSDDSTIRFGLFYNNEMVSIMTFGKPLVYKNYEYELKSFANKLGVRVVGGASKLLKHFEDNYKPKSLVALCDRRLYNGWLFKMIGFRFVNKTRPSFYWFKNKVRLQKYKYNMKNIRNILGDKYNDELSFCENMAKNKWEKIYDCGNFVFEKFF